MKVVQINTFSNKSTGTIMMSIHKYLLQNNIDSYVIWGRGRKSENDHEIFLDDKLGVYFHGLYTRLTDKTGFTSKKTTKNLIKKLDQIKPDVIHLHNLHGYYINIELLFNYIKDNNIRVIWTLHDCWAFTGHCTHFEYVHCEKWKTECYNCPQTRFYPKAFKNNSKWNYNKKKELFTGLNMTIVTPSKWLCNRIKDSYLNAYNCITISNGVNLQIFKNTPNNFRERYHLANKKIILGVASDWSERKGLDDFIYLSKKLSDDYKIVLVGLDENQLRKLNKNILGIKRTDSAKELAEIYSAADVYFNASLEETFGLTTLEAMSCGTPVVVYNSTALAEIVPKDCGIVVNSNNIDDALTSIQFICKNKSFKEEIIVENAKKYDIEICIQKYLDLYR